MEKVGVWMDRSMETKKIRVGQMVDFLTKKMTKKKDQTLKDACLTNGRLGFG